MKAGPVISTRGTTGGLRYELIARWAYNRYTGPRGCILSTGGIPSRYSIIENLAAVKYMGLSDHYGPRL